MKKPRREGTAVSTSMKGDSESAPQEIPETFFNDNSDICRQLLDRYGGSSAPQHRYLCATAAASRSIIQSESLPLSPLSYFAATIDAVSDAANDSLDADAVSALTSFLSIVLPLVPETAIPSDKAVEAVGLLVRLLERPSDVVSTASARAVVKCIGVLVRFCGSDDWDSLKFGFEALLRFSLDKRPKVRKCSQDSVLRTFESLKSSKVNKMASKSVYSLLKNHVPVATEITAPDSTQGNKDGILHKSDNQEALHLLNLLKINFQHLSIEASSRVLLHLKELIFSDSSSLTKLIFEVIEIALGSSKANILVSEFENIMKPLASYVTLGEKNPIATTLFAATLFLNAFKKIHASESSRWINELPLLIRPVSGALTSETNIASRASNFLKELIRCSINERNLITKYKDPVDDGPVCSKELSQAAAVCDAFSNLLRTCSRRPNEHLLEVISVLFLTLGEVSFFHMKDITLQLAEMMYIALKDNSNTKHLEACIGSAVTAMGPEKLHLLLPIFLNMEDFSCPNSWLLPILKDYIIGSTLGFFLDHIVPLAKSFERAYRKVKKLVKGEYLLANAHSCWGLLPAFCRYPTDIQKNFGHLTELIIPYVKKDSDMLEIICLALKELVNQNRNVLGLAKPPNMVDVKDFETQLECKSSCPLKAARRNIRTLASCSEDLFRTLINAFFESSPDKKVYLKEAIGCLASIVDSSISKSIFVSSLERFHLTRDLSEIEKTGIQGNASVGEKENNSILVGTEEQRCLALELAASIIEGAREDLVDLIFYFIKHNLQEADGRAQFEAYQTLSNILQKNSYLCSSKAAEVLDLLLALNPPTDMTALGCRFTCFRTLLVHLLKRSLDEENTKGFLILNEIILTLKDAKEEGRKVANDSIVETGTLLRKLSGTTSQEPFQQFVSMFLGYLSGPSSHIRSGAVSALSILVYNDTSICELIPDLVPSILTLLQSKDIETIKAVLGFVKVLVSSLQTKDLRNFLSDITNGILQWSTVSRHHFRSKVTVILQIMMRKFGLETINLHVPAKYGDFIKSAVMNQGKTVSKEDGNIETKPKQLGSSFTGQQKRKHKQLGLSEKEGDVLRHKRPKTHMKVNNLTGRKSVRCSSVGIMTGVKRRRDLGFATGAGSQSIKREQVEKSGVKRKMEVTNSRKKVASDTRRSKAFSNFSKPRKGVKSKGKGK